MLASLLIAAAATKAPAAVPAPKPAAPATPVVQAAPAAPAAPMAYQKKRLVVYGPADDVVAKGLRDALAREVRFFAYDTTPKPGQTPAAFGAAAFEARPGARDMYVLVPSLAFGRTTSTQPKIDTDKRNDGTWSATASAELECPYTLTLAVLDATTGKQVDSVETTRTLSRRFEYRYDHNTSQEWIQGKALEMARRMANDAGRPPAEAFQTQAERMRPDLAAYAVADLMDTALFRLEVRVAGWSAERDRIAFNLGRDLDVRLDQGFRVLKDGRTVGYLKVRQLEAATSEAQPLYLDEMLAPTDRVVEDRKAMWNHGLRLGGGMIDGGPLYTAGYAGEVNVGPAWFGASERYLTWSLGGVTNFVGGGVAADLGYAHKFYTRRWAWKLGTKVGVMSLNGMTGGTPLPGAAIATGAEYHFNESVSWGLDLDATAFWPYVPKDGPRMGQTIVPYGPLARTGITLLF